MLQKETIMTRAAAYSAAGSMERSSDSLQSLRKFIHEYISELNGKVLHELKLEAFISGFISQTSTAEDVLDKLTDQLMEESEKKDSFVQLPRLPSRTVKLHKEPEKRAVTEGIGATAPLNEAGYSSVADANDNDQMVIYITRTAESLGLEVVAPKVIPAFARWYDNSCSK